MASSATSKVPFWDEKTEECEQNIEEWITMDTPANETPWTIFSPKEEHCGMWHSSPNKERHASFGDEGTTASTACYGDLSQMSRFLGAGHSGVFTIDQSSTSEPYGPLFDSTRSLLLTNLPDAISPAGLETWIHALPTEAATFLSDSLYPRNISRVRTNLQK